VLLERVRSLDVAPHDIGTVVIEHSPEKTKYSPEKVEELLGQRVVGVIGYSVAAVQDAAERGEPLMLSHPESDIALRIKGLCQTLLA
jgi:Flp pilus assembly CpaE family ATPase